MDDYEKWTKEVCYFIYPTRPGYTFDLDGVDHKSMPYNKNNVSSRDVAFALLYEKVQLMEAVEAVSDE